MRSGVGWGGGEGGGNGEARLARFSTCNHILSLGPNLLVPVGLAGVVLLGKVHPQAGLHGGGGDLQHPGGRVQAFTQLGHTRNCLQTQLLSEVEKLRFPSGVPYLEPCALQDTSKWPEDQSLRRR